MILRIVENINIRQDDLLTPEEFFEAQADNNLEGILKEKFIEIIRRNTNDRNVIKLIDLKNLYVDMLDQSIQNNPQTEQIFKNLTSSNKDNKTHLLRNQYINWYYLLPSGETGNRIEAAVEDLKPLPLPIELERSRRKRYYVFYASELHDSPLTTIEEVINDAIETDDNDYGQIDFDNIDESKVDFVAKQQLSEIIGHVGEDYVLKYETEKLRKLNINREPVWVSQKNDKYGFDILSYELINGEIVNKYIEVKTTTGGLHSNFYISQNEIDVSNIYDQSYFIYRVYGAGDDQTISHEEFRGSVSNSQNFENVRVERTHIYKVIRR